MLKEEENWRNNWRYWERNGKGCVWGVYLHLKRLVIPEFFIIELLTSLQLLYRGQGGSGPSAERRERDGGGKELLEPVRQLVLKARVFLARTHSLLINLAGTDNFKHAGSVIRFVLLLIELPLEVASKDLCSPSEALFLLLVRPSVPCLGFVLCLQLDYSVMDWLSMLYYEWVIVLQSPNYSTSDYCFDRVLVICYAHLNSVFINSIIGM